MEAIHVLVIDDNRVITTKLKAMLKRVGYSATTKNDPIEALKWLRIPGNDPDLIIADLYMPKLSGQDLVRHIRSDPMLSHLPFILLTGSSETEDKVAGFEAGVDDYLEKSVSQAELEVRIRSLVARTKTLRERQAGAEATVISVFSLRGGVGTTSMAVNLSIALAQLHKKHVPLIDLALTHSSCPIMLNFEPDNALSTLVNWEESVMEAETIERLLLKHKSGVKLLPGALSTVEAELVTPAVVDRVWPYLRATYPYIVIDAGRELNEVALTLLERSRHILLMLAPDLPSLKAAVDARKIFKELGFEAKAIKPLLNHTFPHKGLQDKFIERVLKEKPWAVLPYERSDVNRAINSGVPLMVESAKSKLGRAITSVARTLDDGQTGAKGKARATEPADLLSQARELIPLL